MAFGADFNGLETGGLYEAFETVIFTLTVRTGQLPGAQYMPTAANRKFDAALRQLDDAVQSIVQVLPAIRFRVCPQVRWALCGACACSRRRAIRK